MISVNGSTTTLTFTAPPLHFGWFSATVVVMVTAVNRFGIGTASNPASAEITSMYMYVHIAMSIGVLLAIIYRKKLSL